jgi:hypothetical protein
MHVYEWKTEGGRVRLGVYHVGVFVLCLQPLVPGADVFWVCHSSGGIFSTIWSYSKESTVAWWSHLSCSDYTW